MAKSLGHAFLTLSAVAVQRRNDRHTPSSCQRCHDTRTIVHGFRTIRNDRRQQQLVAELHIASPYVVSRLI